MRLTNKKTLSEVVPLKMYYSDPSHLVFDFISYLILRNQNFVIVMILMMGVSSGNCNFNNNKSWPDQMATRSKAHPHFSSANHFKGTAKTS